MPTPAALFDYKGPTSWAQTGEVNVPAASSQRQIRSMPDLSGLQYDNGNVVRTSVGVGLIWASPFGPLRFDYAVPLTKGQYRSRAAIQVRRRHIVLSERIRLLRLIPKAGLLTGRNGAAARGMALKF